VNLPYISERLTAFRDRWRPAVQRVLSKPRVGRAIVPALFLLGSLIAFHGLLLPYGGRFYDGDFVTPTTPADLHYYLEAFAGPWNPGSITFGFNPFFTNNLLLMSAVGALSVAFGSVGTGMLGVLVLIEAGLGLSVYLSARRMGVALPWALVAGLASAASPVVFDRTVAGHEIILAAALLVPPFLVLLSEATSRPVGARHIAVLGLLWGAIGLLEYHMFYIVGLVWISGVLAIALRSAFGRDREPWRDRVRSGLRLFLGLASALAVAVGVNLLWLVPAATYAGGSTALSSSTATTLGILNYTQDGIRPATVFASNVYWGQLYTASWGHLAGASVGIDVSWLLSGLFISVLAWHAYHRSRETDTLVLIALVFVVLSTGAILPGGLYLFLLHHVPFFAVNDDPAKFDVVLTPCLALLLGNALQHWWQSAKGRAPTTTTSRFPRWRSSAYRLQRIGVPAAVLLVVVVALPFASGNFTGLVAHVSDAPGALRTAKTLDATVPPLGRVVLLPPDASEYVGGGQSPTNPLVVYPPGSAIYLPGPPGIEPLNLATRATTWSYTALYANTTSHGASLFGLLGGTSWVVDLSAPVSPQSGHFYWDDPSALSATLATQVGLGPGVTNGQTRIYTPANASPGPLTLRGPSVLALGDRELLLDSAYLPNGDAWLRSSAFVLDSGGARAGTNSPANATTPFVETPDGILDTVFSELPPGSVVPVEPIVWSEFGAGGLLIPGLWSPWENHLGLENGRPLGALVGYGTSNNGLRPLTVPLPVAGGPRSEVWVDLFYGPSEGSVQASLGSSPPTTLNGFAAVPGGFHWTPVAPLGNRSSVAFTHAGPGWTTIAAVAVVPPNSFSNAVNATEGWLSANGAGPGQPPVLWVKGDAGTGYGTWKAVGTGSLDSQGWGSVVDVDGAFATTFLLPQRTTLGVLARASGSGSIYISACPGDSLSDRSLAPCPQHTEVSFNDVAPTWQASNSNVTVGPGVVEVTVYGAQSSVLLDQLLLTPSAPSLLGPCPGAPASDWVCQGASRGPVSITGNVGGPSVAATFASSPSPAVLVHLVSCDVDWTASGPGFTGAPFVVDGWACGYRADGGATQVTVGLPGLVLAAEAGAIGSILVAVPVIVVALIGVPRLRGWRRRGPPKPSD
jgi:hypothetical protein